MHKMQRVGAVAMNIPSAIFLPNNTARTLSDCDTPLQFVLDRADVRVTPCLVDDTPLLPPDTLTAHSTRPIRQQWPQRHIEVADWCG